MLFYQEFADVIIIDQRGAVNSFPSFRCRGSAKNLPLDQPLTFEDRFRAEAKDVKACKKFWQEKGFDLTALNTLENADDINDLRKALGYDKINLVGGSYGSHLGLTILRRHPDMVEHAMLRGLEGPNHSYHVPSQVLNALERFAAVVEAAPAWQSHVPEGGFIAALRRIENELAENPKTVDLKIDGLDISITLGKYDIQNIATSNANYRGRFHHRRKAFEGI